MHRVGSKALRKPLPHPHASVARPSNHGRNHASTAGSSPRTYAHPGARLLNSAPLADSSGLRPKASKRSVSPLTSHAAARSAETHDWQRRTDQPRPTAAALIVAFPDGSPARCCEVVVSAAIVPSSGAISMPPMRHGLSTSNCLPHAKCSSVLSRTAQRDAGLTAGWRTIPSVQPPLQVPARTPGGCAWTGE